MPKKHSTISHSTFSTTKEISMKAPAINSQWLNNNIRIRTHTGETHIGVFSLLAPEPHEQFIILDWKTPQEITIDITGIESIKLA